MCWKKVSPFSLDAGAPQAWGQIKLPHPPVSHAENMDLVRFINSYPPQRRMKLHHVSFRRSHKFILWQAAAVFNTWIPQLPLCSIQANLENMSRKTIVLLETVLLIYTIQLYIYEKKRCMLMQPKPEWKKNLWWSINMICYRYIDIQRYIQGLFCHF